jgi:hypothetical protein
MPDKNVNKKTGERHKATISSNIRPKTDKLKNLAGSWQGAMVF